MKKSFFTGLAAVLALAGCSTDEELKSVTPNVIGADGTAYMNVRISDVNSGTRATDGGFEESKLEHDVASADFYFYDVNGLFVTTANVWNDGNNVDGGNIEFNGNTIVALKGLTDTTLPKYLVTVLNRPASLDTPAATLAEMLAKLSDENAEDGGFMSGDNFIMTTSSYASDCEYYFVTELKENNFVPEASDLDDADRVTIYVERLAAKVKVEFVPGDPEENENALVPAKDAEGKDLENTFALKMTVAGEANEAGSTSIIGSEDVHIHFLGWALNATAKKSYLMKNIDPEWDNDVLGFAWNDLFNHRSYWGMSYNYGKIEELNYANYTDASPINKAIYCAENTNTSGNVSDDPSNTITSALLFAEITDVNGGPLDMVRYNGIFYKESHYIAYVFSNLNRVKSLEYYTETVLEDNSKKYTQISTDNAEVANIENGNVVVALTLPLNTPLYRKVGDTYVKIEDKDGKTAVEQANAVLANFNATNKAIGYKGGLMYYNVPIQHFNNEDIVDNKVPEAKYGIVRNHIYVLQITSIARPGMGIFDPEEEIIPEDPFNEDELYQVGANVKILSWKVVNQGVDL